MNGTLGEKNGHFSGNFSKVSMIFKALGVQFMFLLNRILCEDGTFLVDSDFQLRPPNPRTNTRVVDYLHMLSLSKSISHSIVSDSSQPHGP